MSTLGMKLDSIGDMKTNKANPCYNTGCMHLLFKYSELQSITYVAYLITFSLSTENLSTSFKFKPASSSS